jgi:hypothetical protein
VPQEPRELQEQPVRVRPVLLVQERPEREQEPQEQPVREQEPREQRAGQAEL